MEKYEAGRQLDCPKCGIKTASPSAYYGYEHAMHSTGGRYVLKIRCGNCGYEEEREPLDKK